MRAWGGNPQDREEWRTIVKEVKVHLRLQRQQKKKNILQFYREFFSVVALASLSCRLRNADLCSVLVTLISSCRRIPKALCDTFMLLLLSKRYANYVHALILFPSILIEP